MEILTLDSIIDCTIKMSKKRKTKKYTEKNPKPMKKSAAKRILTAAIVVLTAAICTTAIIIGVNSYNSSDVAQLVNYNWVPSGATNSSGDEVDLNEIYNTHYTNYNGLLEFKDDGKFYLWLNPGDISDGTHSGTYELSDDDTITACFDEGTETTFKIERSNSGINSITINYGDYQILFFKEEIER